MNLLSCNLIRQGFGNGMPKQNGPQRMQFHQAAGSSNSPSQKKFQNPNIFTQTSPDKPTPSSYKQTNISEDKNEQVNPKNSCDMILEPIKQTNEEKISINETKNPETEMKNSEELSDSSDDSFIVFEREEGAPSEEEPEIVDDDSSDEASDDEDWNCRSVVFFSSQSHTRGRKESVTESEDSFIVFEDVDSDRCAEQEEDVESSDEDEEEENKKPDNGKKVKFAEGPGFCRVHLMVKWSFAYRKARKGLWEQYGRDNERFKFRAMAFGDQLKKYLQPEHRRKVYEERFKDKEE